MDINSSLSPNQLASVYATYFAQDYAQDVLSNLSGSYPIDPAVLKTSVNKTVADKIGGTPIALASDNSICRFLYECAEHAINNNVEDPESYEAFQKIAGMPSLHHQELGSFIFAASDLYNKTLKSTLLGVVAKDADTAAKAIVQAAQTRTTMDDTGGTLHFFNWGILNDGLWLNGALLKAYKLANIFRPGDTPVVYYAQTAFRFAYQFSSMPMLGDEESTWVYGEIDSLLSYVTSPDLDNLLAEVPQSDLVSLLFGTGVLSSYVTSWERGMTSPYQMVNAVKQLSVLAHILVMLEEACAKAEGDMGISSATKTRIDTAYNVVVLALVAFEALRETKLSESLILDIYAEGEDPKVDVTINKDVVHSFHAAGGEDADLIRFGLYLDPRKGIPASSNGWSLSWVMGRRDDVIPKMMADDADRLLKLRFNDAAVIEQETQRIIGDVVRSYLEASNQQTLRPSIRQKIATISRMVTREDKEISLTEEIMSVLLEVLNDPTVSMMGQMLMSNVTKDAENAQALTIAQMAATDVINLMTTATIAE